MNLNPAHLQQRASIVGWMVCTLVRYTHLILLRSITKHSSFSAFIDVMRLHMQGAHIILQEEHRLMTEKARLGTYTIAYDVIWKTVTLWTEGVVLNFGSI